MSINSLLTPTPPNKPWSNLYVQSINVTDGIITEGNITVANANPSVSIQNTIGNTNRATLELKGNPANGVAKLQQNQTGGIILENFATNQGISLVPNGSGQVSITGNLAATGSLSAGTTLSSTGNLTVGGTAGITGNITAPGIIFPSSATLNRYVENTTFTPTLDFSVSTDAGIVYTSQVGNFSRIGLIVFFTLEVGVSDIKTSTGDARIAGLPLIIHPGTVGSLLGACSWSAITYTANYNEVAATAATSLLIGLSECGSANNNQIALTQAAFCQGGATTIIKISGHYSSF